MKQEIQQSKTAEGPMEREFIMAMLRKKYGSALEFERKADLRDRSVRDVLSDRCQNDRTAKAISDALDIPIHLISPTYFQSHYPIGTNTTEKQKNHRLNERAA